MSDLALAPGARIGILGGGQLGAMLASAASEMGLQPFIYADQAGSPAFQRVADHVCAPYEDVAALKAFAGRVDVLTYEFENVPIEPLLALGSAAPIRPGIAALQVAQDRLLEKDFLKRNGLPLAAYHAVDSLADLQAGVASIGLPAVLKTRRFGYDGKGQVLLKPETDLAAAYAQLQHAPCVLEAFVPFFAETSSIVARGVAGDVAIYEMGLNTHKNHILDTTTLPSGLPQRTLEAAAEQARQIVDALEYVGVMGVEFFVAGAPDDPDLLINEIAPRVHNSGHWTQDGAVICQFEQHIRAICGWPLGDVTRLSDITMHNLIGDAVGAWQEHAAQPGARLHLYGKESARPGRKMGHLNVLRGAVKA